MQTKLIKFHFIILLILVVNFFLSSCSDKKEENNIDSEVQNTSVEQKYDSSYVNGRLIYATACIQCHELNSVLVGPALATVSQRRSLDWIKKWIKSPDSMIHSKDSIALILYNQYQQFMPEHYYLSDKDIEDIVYFLDEQAKNKTNNSIALADLFIIEKCEDIEKAKNTDRQIVFNMHYDKCEQQIYSIADKIDFIPLGSVEDYIMYGNTKHPKTKEEIENNKRTKTFAKKMKELNPSIRIEYSRY